MIDLIKKYIKNNNDRDYMVNYLQAEIYINQAKLARTRERQKTKNKNI